MRMTSIDPSRQIRIGLTAITLILMACGLVMVFSSSALYADQVYSDSAYFLKKHLLAIFMGLVSLICAMIFDYKKLRNVATPLMVIIGVLLVLVLIPGIGAKGGGAQRWFRFLGFQVQPAEFAKLVILIFFASQISQRPDIVQSMKRSLFRVLGIIGGLLILILLERDLGTPVVIGMVVMALLITSGMRWKHLSMLFGVSLMAFATAILIEPYRFKRLVSFLKPWEDFQGAGFQLWQSFLALGSGGLWGVGLGMSQEKLFFLPGAHTDFIFSIIGEELGFAGGMAVIFLYIGFLILGLMIVLRCPDMFGQLLSFGIMVLILSEVIINIGVSLGMLPTKGMALPFISYGGSSLVVKMFCVGLLLNISRDA